jgi:hypothetical protein
LHHFPETTPGKKSWRHPEKTWGNLHFYNLSTPDKYNHFALGKCSIMLISNATKNIHGITLAIKKPHRQDNFTV